MGRMPLSAAFVISAALAVSPVGAAPDSTAASGGCSANSEDVTPTLDKNLLMRSKAEPHPGVAALPQGTAAVLVSESHESTQILPVNKKRPPTPAPMSYAKIHRRRWQGVDPKLDEVRRRRRRDPTDFEIKPHERRRSDWNRRRPHRSPGNDCGDIELKIMSASGLRDADMFSSGTSDAWVTFRYWFCGDDTYSDIGPLEKHTQYVSDSENPVWNYTTTIKSIDFGHKVVLSVVDADDFLWRGDILGTFHGKLKDLEPPGEPAPHELPAETGEIAKRATLTWGWKLLPKRK